VRLVLLHWIGNYWFFVIFTPGQGYYPVYYFGKGAASKPPTEQIEDNAGIELEIHYK
jgi:hypothetical protein